MDKIYSLDQLNHEREFREMNAGDLSLLKAGWIMFKMHMKHLVRTRIYWRSQQNKWNNLEINSTVNEIVEDKYSNIIEYILTNF